MKLNSISETFDPAFKEAYIKYGRGKITGATDSGKFYKWATFIRKDKNSSWLLDEIGEG